MSAVKVEALRLVAELLKKNGYIIAAIEAQFPDYEWPKLPGLVDLVASLLEQDKFVPPADPDELAVLALGRQFRYWDNSYSLDQVKKTWSISFKEQLVIYRAGKAAANG